MAIFYTDSASFNDVELTGSIRVTGSFSLVGSNLIGTSSFANTASFVEYANVANKPALVSSSTQFTSLTAPFTGSFTGSFTGNGSGITGVTAASVDYVNVTNKPSLVSSSTQFNSLTAPFTGSFTGSFTGNGSGLTNVTATAVDFNNITNKPALVSASAQINTGSFTGSFVGILTGTGSWANSASVAISSSYVLPTGLPANIASSSAQVVSFILNQTIAPAIVSASTAITASNVQLNGLVDTTATNKVLVLDTSTNKIFTTASVGTGGGGGNAFGTIAVAGQSNVVADQTNDTLTLVAGTNVTITTDAGTDTITINSTGGGGSTFPYTGSAIISGSLQTTGSIFIEGNGSTNTLLNGTNTLNDYTQIIVQNLSNGINASTDVVLAADNATDFQNFIDLGINSTGFVGHIGNANDGYLYMTSSAGELVIGNATTNANGNVRLFAGGGDTTLVTRIFISASGQLGIGTTNLTDTLTISGSTDFTGSLYVTNNVNASAFVGDGSQLTNMVGKTIAYSTFQYFL